MNKSDNKIINNIDNILDSILAIKYDYNIKDIFKNVDKDMCVQFINYYLNNIVEFGNITILKKMQIVSNNQNELSYNIFSDILSFFSDTYINIDEDLQNEAERIVWDLCYKLFGYNNRKITLPLTYKEIDNYVINYYIDDKNVIFVYMYMVLMLSIIDKLIKKNI